MGEFTIEIPFCKYQGAGNDFIVIDNRNGIFKPKDKVLFISRACHRRYGIGADGLIEVIKKGKGDVEMVYYNSDGLTGSFCGNGARCFVSFCKRIGVMDKPDLEFFACDGRHQAEIEDNGTVKLKMNDVKHITVFDEHTVFLNTGSPHYVRFVENIDNVDVEREGAMVRYDKKFKDIGGTNVNFVSVSGDCVNVRTYERGVEQETWACGTGAVACGLAYLVWSNSKLKTVQDELKKEINHECRIRTRGGDLMVSFTQSGSKQFRNVHLHGPANFVFHGNIQCIVKESEGT